MHRLMRHYRLITALAALFALTACAANAPPNLSPVARQAFVATRVIKGLDLIRDTAITANAQLPPLLSTDATRAIVEYHRSSLLVMQDVPNGWKVTVLTGLNEMVRRLPPHDAQLIAPYVALTKTILAEVIQ